jgi:hypothetical protein
VALSPLNGVKLRFSGRKIGRRRKARTAAITVETVWFLSFHDNQPYVSGSFDLQLSSWGPVSTRVGGDSLGDLRVLSAFYLFSPLNVVENKHWVKPGGRSEEVGLLPGCNG